MSLLETIGSKGSNFYQRLTMSSAREQQIHFQARKDLEILAKQKDIAELRLEDAARLEQGDFDPIDLLELPRKQKNALSREGVLTIYGLEECLETGIHLSSTNTAGEKILRDALKQHYDTPKEILDRKFEDWKKSGGMESYNITFWLKRAKEQKPQILQSEEDSPQTQPISPKQPTISEKEVVEATDSNLDLLTIMHIGIPESDELLRLEPKSPRHDFCKRVLAIYCLLKGLNMDEYHPERLTYKEWKSVLEVYLEIRRKNKHLKNVRQTVNAAITRKGRSMV